MTTILKNTTIAGTGHLTIPVGTTTQRPAVNTSIIRWTNTGSQSYSVLAGSTPTLTNTTWTAPAGVNTVEVLVVAGGGGGGSDLAGGGGAGGLIYNSNFSVTPGTAYNVTVGAGGLGGQAVRMSTSVGTNGSNSVFNNLITNGTFNTDTTGWSSPGTATLSVVSGAIRVTNISTNGRAQSTAFTTIPGRSYIASVTGVNRTAANYYFEVRSGVESSDSWTSGAVQRTFVAVQSTTYIELYAIGGAGVYAEYDNVSVSEVGLTAIGGGGGGAYWESNNTYDRGKDGGSGGGNGARDSTLSPNGAGQGTSGQGFAGGLAGIASNYSGGGGGGAGGPGSNAVIGSYIPGGGGPGLNFGISSQPTWYAGGGGGSNYHAGNSNTFGASGGIGGGGAGGYNITSPQRDGIAGTASTGGGGGGGSWTGSNPAIGGTGGSGVVILRYNSLSDGTDTRALVRYNTDLRDVEMFEGPSIGWQAQDTARNLGGHNLIKYNDQLETAPPNTTSNGQTFHWTQFGSSVQTTAVTPPFITNTLVALNPLDTNGGTVGANGLTFTDAGSAGWNTCRANIGVSSGKWYWEYRSVVDTGVMCASIMSKSAPQSDLPGQTSNFGVTLYANGALYKETNSGGTSGWGASFGVTDIIGIALDMNAGKVYFSKNGIWQNSADPVAGTGAASTSLLTYDSVYYPAAATYYAGSVASLNFGNSTFRYGPPAGFLPYAQARSVTKLNSPASGSSYGLLNVNWQSNVAFTVGKTYTFSIFAKAAEWTRLGIRLYDGSVAYFIRATVNLSTGTLISANEAGTTTITPYGNGWYKVSVTGVCTASGTNTISVEAHNTAIVQNDEASNGGGIYIYGAQFEEGSGSEALVITKDQASPIPTSIGNYRTHTYTTVGTSGFTPLVSGNVEVLVVAGGGGGSNYNSAGGGGAGGLIYNANYPVIAGRNYTVTVGAGGVGAMTLSGTYTDAIASATSGSNSQFGTLIAIGGGHGGQGNVQGSRTDQYPSAGGSGGGARESNGVGGSATAGQGNKGGAGGTYSGNYPGGGGGGAGAPGGDGNDTVIAGEGGAGLQFSISGTPTYYAGGGAGSTQGSGTNPPGGLGGGGAGGAGTGGSTQNGVSGTANTGGGGGAGGYNGSVGVGGNGGSGVVIVRYRYE